MNKHIKTTLILLAALITPIFFLKECWILLIIATFILVIVIMYNSILVWFDNKD